MLLALYANVNGFDKIIKICQIGNNTIMMTTEIVTTYANQSEQKVDIQELLSYALQNEYVLGARAFEHNGTLVIATLTVPFYLKSERDGVKRQLGDELQAIAGEREIILTFDMQVFRNIEDGLDESEKQRLIDLAKSR